MINRTVCLLYELKNTITATVGTTRETKRLQAGGYLPINRRNLASAVLRSGTGGRIPKWRTNRWSRTD
jgi:hypothetical protein